MPKMGGLNYIWHLFCVSVEKEIQTDRVGGEREKRQRILESSLLIRTYVLWD
jgi:hypothetical protein